MHVPPHWVCPLLQGTLSPRPLSRPRPLPRDPGVLVWVEAGLAAGVAVWAGGWRPPRAAPRTAP